MDSFRFPQLDIAFEHQQKLLIRPVNVTGKALFSWWEEKHAGPQHLATETPPEANSVPSLAGLVLRLVELRAKYVFHCRSLRDGDMAGRLGDRQRYGEPNRHQSTTGRQKTAGSQPLRQPD